MDRAVAGFIIDVMKSFAGGFSGICSMIPQCELIMLGFRIIVLLFLIQWVRMRLGGGMIASVVVLVIGYFVLFEFWWLFGPLAIVYLAAIFGAIGLVTDFFFTKQHYFPETGMPNERPPPFI